MITNRTNPRQSIYLYLTQFAAAAAHEKAEDTAELIAETSEAILISTAASNSADPERMAALLENQDYRAKAESYLVKNWFLNTGLPDLSESLPVRTERNLAAVKEVLNAFCNEFGEVGEITAGAIGERIEDISKQFLSEENFKIGHGHGTSTLLREVLGLPGDQDVCVMETNPRVVLNAAVALTRLGVEISNDELLRLRAEAGVEPEPEPGM